MTDKIVLGLDGGGTKTTCVAVSAAGVVLGSGHSGSSNRNSVGDATARANLAAAIRATLQATSYQPSAVAAICAGMAGVDRAPERAAITQWLSELLPGVTLQIENDAMIALAGGTGGELFGVVVISGTGMIVYGVDRNGQRQRAGGWGALLDAHGSGYAMGMAALQAIARAVDTAGPETALQTAILDHLRLSQPQALIAWTYSSLTWARFAELAPLVVQCAEAQDEVALQIVEETVRSLAAAVEAVTRRLSLQAVAFPLVLAGGNLGPGLLRDRLCRRLAGLVPQAHLTGPSVEPAIGAAWLALQRKESSWLVSSQTNEPTTQPTTLPTCYP